MTAAVARTPRPVLYLVPSVRPPSRSASRPAAAVAPPLPVVAAKVATRALGTLFAPVAARVAGRFADRAPLPARRSRPEPWAAAIVFLLAEEARLFAYDSRTTRTSFARELGSTLPTLRRRAATVRAALRPGELDLPAPDPDAL